MTDPGAVLLLVDDDEQLRSGLARLLELEGYTCLEAGASGAAQEVLRSRPDVAAMLCDVTMPAGSGIELLTKVNRDYPRVAVIMLTGSDNPNLAKFALKHGAFDYVTKPFDPTLLVATVAAALARASG